MNAFTVRTFDTLDPAYVQDDSDDLHEARFWTLHLCVPVAQTPGELAEAVLRTGAESLTGDYVGGDSFTAWCEGYPHVPDDDQALHVYFRANGYDAATAVARALVDRLGFPSHEYALSTARDWAIQTPVGV